MPKPMPDEPAVVSGPGYRLALIVGLWIAAILIVAAQAYLLRALVAANRYSAHFGGEFLVPSPRWHLWGVFVPLIIATTALYLQFRWSKGGWRKVGKAGLILIVPVYLAGLTLSLIIPPNAIDSVTLHDGRRFILAVEPVPTDVVYSLHQSSGPLGIYWRQAGDLDYSEDGRFVGREGLVVSPDETWLLMRRAGIWSDCFRIRAGGLQRVDTGVIPRWDRPDFSSLMHERSRRIAALTRLRP